MPFKFLAALLWHGKSLIKAGNLNINQMVSKLNEIMEEECNVAAPRIGSIRQAYWWSDHIASLRFDCIKTRRKWQRAKKKRRSEKIIGEYGNQYKNKRKEL